MTESAKSSVVVLGASPKAHRYSHQATCLLDQTGYPVIPVHPTAGEVCGQPVLRHITDVAGPVHTLTLYVSSAHLEPLTDEILQLAPQRVIFNPGTESRRVQARLSQAGIGWVEDCTLVMLRAGAF